MIQRIQSVYLLLAALFMVLFYMFPIAIFTTDNYAFEFFNCHITHPENLEPPVALLPLAIIPVLSVLLSMVTLFLFKKRKLQLRLNKVNILLLSMVIVAVVFYFIRINNLLNGTVGYGFSGVFPVISLIAILMSNKGIKRDEALVRAADRIR